MINYKIDDTHILLNCIPFYSKFLGLDTSFREDLEEFLLQKYEVFKRYPPEVGGGITAGRTSYFEGDLFKINNPLIKELKNKLLDESQKYYSFIADLSSAQDLGIDIMG